MTEDVEEWKYGFGFWFAAGGLDNETFDGLRQHLAEMKAETFFEDECKGRVISYVGFEEFVAPLGNEIHLC